MSIKQGPSGKVGTRRYATYGLGSARREDVVPLGWTLPVDGVDVGGTCQRSAQPALAVHGISMTRCM
eukprot:6449688-Prymnesium_polylepis.1